MSESAKKRKRADDVWGHERVEEWRVNATMVTESYFTSRLFQIVTTIEIIFYIYCAPCQHATTQMVLPYLR